MSVVITQGAGGNVGSEERRMKTHLVMLVVATGVAGAVAQEVGTVVPGTAEGRTSGELSMVAGGKGNSASGLYSFVAGGQFGTASALNSVLVGGSFNNASALSSMVAGGVYNTASNTDSMVAGGCNNTASGYASMVAGGFQCAPRVAPLPRSQVATTAPLRPTRAPRSAQTS